MNWFRTHAHHPPTHPPTNRPTDPLTHPSTHHTHTHAHTPTHGNTTKVSEHTNIPAPIFLPCRTSKRSQQLHTKLPACRVAPAGCGRVGQRGVGGSPGGERAVLELPVALLLVPDPAGEGVPVPRGTDVFATMHAATNLGMSPQQHKLMCAVAISCGARRVRRRKQHFLCRVASLCH